MTRFTSDGSSACLQDPISSFRIFDDAEELFRMFDNAEALFRILDDAEDSFRISADAEDSFRISDDAEALFRSGCTQRITSVTVGFVLAELREHSFRSERVDLAVQALDERQLRMPGTRGG